jgi:hypothetical protein
MNPSENEVEGASLPHGIAVDEAAAYFGVTDSADIIMHLNQTDPINGMGEFFSIAIDLVMQPEFGFEEAANRLGCEGGEIYYLLTGPFALVALSDPLRMYLGGEDSEGNTGVHPGLPEHEMSSLEQLTDIFSLLKMFGLGHLIGGLPLLAHYVSQYTRLVAASDANKAILLQLSQELKNAVEQAKSGSVTPISCLGAPTHASQPAPISSQPVVSAAAVPQPALAPQPAPAPAPAVVPAPAPAVAPQPALAPQPAPAPAPAVVPAPAPAVAPQPALAPQPAAVPAPAPQLAPAPTSPQPVDVESLQPTGQPFVEPAVIAPEPAVEHNPNLPTNDQQVATSDAFASQFSAAAEIDAPVAPVESPQPVTPPSPTVVESSEPVIEPQIAASPASASPVEVEPVVEKTPETVTPKRAPIAPSGPPKPATGWPTQEPPQMPDTGWPVAPTNSPQQSASDSVSDLVSGGPHAPRAVAESVHHNIQSGKNCSRCGIGVEQSWQYCPVCNCDL